MNKKFLTMAAAAMLFAACSDDLKEVQGAPEIAQNPTEVVNGPTPISFGVYLNRATTRAGLGGDLTTGASNFTAYDNNGTDADDTDDRLASWGGFEGAGFGVFAYYTDNDLYSETAKPNFMYNERVYKSTDNNPSATAYDDASISGWTYSPLRYWPNETGNDATSDDIDRVSFFAYAPYVSVTPSTGVVTNGAAYDGDNGDQTTGIVGMTRNTAVGDPMIKYYVNPKPGNSVDLCYGVANVPYTTVGGSVAEGKPMLNLTKLNAAEKLQFRFNHALAALNVQIDAAVDDINVGNALDDKTRIYVRSITFEGLADKGMLNLRDGNWYDMTGDNPVSGTVTIYDGRSNGREAVFEASNELPASFNPDVVQNGATAQVGVTASPVNLFNSEIVIPDPVIDNTDPENPVVTNQAEIDAAASAKLSEPIYVIPTGQTLRVNIVYDVETQVDNLPGYLSGSDVHGTSVENNITQTISGFTLAKGRKNVLKIHLGMVSAKFEAAVADWDDQTANPQQISLPANVAGTLSTLKDDLDELNAAVAASTMTENEANEALATLKSKYIGKYVSADGSISSGKGSNTVGMIAQMEWQDGKIDASTGLEAARVLVMAADNAPIMHQGVKQTTYPWWGFGTAAVGASGAPATTSVWAATYSQLADAAALEAMRADVKDVLDTWSANTTNNNDIRNAVWSDASNKLKGKEVFDSWVAKRDAQASDEDKARYYAINGVTGFKATENSTEGVPGVAGALSDWYLPTIQQMINIGAAPQRYHADTATYPQGKEYATSEIFSSIITSGYYWSVSEASATGAWRYNASNGFWGNSAKAGNTYSVRPVFAY